MTEKWPTNFNLKLGRVSFFSEFFFAIVDFLTKDWLWTDLVEVVLVAAAVVFNFVLLKINANLNPHTTVEQLVVVFCLLFPNFYKLLFAFVCLNLPLDLINHFMVHFGPHLSLLQQFESFVLYVVQIYSSPWLPLLLVHSCGLPFSKKRYLFIIQFICILGGGGGGRVFFQEIRPCQETMCRH